MPKCIELSLCGAAPECFECGQGVFESYPCGAAPECVGWRPRPVRRSPRVVQVTAEDFSSLDLYGAAPECVGWRPRFLLRPVRRSPRVVRVAA